MLALLTEREKMRFLVLKIQKISNNPMKLQKIGGNNMIHGFKSETKEKVNLSDVIVKRKFTVNFNGKNVPAGSSWAFYINPEDYELEGYTFLGVVMLYQKHFLALCGWFMSGDKLCISTLNTASYVVSNPSFTITGLYIKNE